MQSQKKEWITPTHMFQVTNHTKQVKRLTTQW